MQIVLVCSGLQLASCCTHDNQNRLCMHMPGNYRLTLNKKQNKERPENSEFKNNNSTKCYFAGDKSDAEVNAFGLFTMMESSA